MYKKENAKEENPPTLQKLFGDSSIAKILDYLTLFKSFDYPKTEISKNSGVAWKTLYRIWPTLEKYGLVVRTRQIGRAELYKLNEENPIAKALNELAFHIAKYDAQKIAAEEKAKEKDEIKVSA
jgi:predicted transcriptional regulator